MIRRGRARAWHQSRAPGGGRPHLARVVLRPAYPAHVISVLAAVVGGALVLLTGRSVTRTLVVPRRTTDHLSRGVGLGVDAVYRLATRWQTDFLARDRRLASQAATTLLAQLTAWLVSFYVGYGLLLWPLAPHGLGQAFSQAGSSLFTLGYAGPTNPPLTVVDYLAAATGLVVVALQIGYLPSLYGAFNRRETEVTMLTSRAGVPAWGPEILARTRFGFTDEDEGAVMDAFYLDWERWAADLAESHSNYPVLTRFRSPEPLSSWLVGLVAVMDSAALWLALSPQRSPQVQARLCLRMGFTALRSIADAVGLDVDRDPDPDTPLRLTQQEWEAGIARMSSAGFHMERSPEQAYPDFRGWRVNYEAVAYALALRTEAVPAPWTGPRRLDNLSMPPIRPVNRTPTPYGVGGPDGPSEAP